jgi:glycosyltransferase involved in cell wall biosynthesis
MNEEFKKLQESWLDFEQFKLKYQKVEVEEYPNNVLKVVPKPEISVHIITFQHASYIREAIEGVLMQKVDVPWEIILGDDESSDGTREICIEYAQKYPNLIRLFLHKRENNIKVRDKPTGIFQVAYNILNCKGKYLSLLGGDDYWQDKNKINIQIRHLRGNNKILFNFHDHVNIYMSNDKKIIKKRKIIKKAEKIQTIVGINMFNKLPIEFTQIMQEDSFFKFFWKSLGNAQYLHNIDPSVIRFHSNSMYTSLDEDEVYKQRLNLWSNVISSCNNQTKFIKKAKSKYFKVIYSYYTRNGKVYLFKNLFPFLSEIKRNGLYDEFFLYFFRKNKF